MWSGHRVSRDEKILPRRSTASKDSRETQPPLAHRSRRRDASSSAVLPASASASLVGPSAPRTASQTPAQKTPNRWPPPTRTVDAAGPTACSSASGRARPVPLPAHFSLVSSFASFRNLNSQSLQILSSLFHPVAQYLLLRFHLIRLDYVVSSHE